MALTIITADQRMATMTLKMQIWGGAGVGKTTLLKTLPPENTLAITPEGGMLAVQRDDQFGPAYRGDSMEPNTWPEHKAVLEGFKTKAPGLSKYKNVFIDSTSIISKHCFDWCKTQPDAFSEKTGKPDTRGAYGLLGREMTEWAWGWKGVDHVNVFLIGGLELKENDLKIKEWSPLVMGGRLASELPYIFDYSLVMARFKAADGATYAGLFTDPIKNPEYASVPVKTRGGGFEAIEQPHLGKLMAKALGTPAVSAPPPSAVISPPGDGTPATPNQSEAA